MMSKLKLDTCEISYSQSREDGIPIVFVHENSLGGETFNEVLNSELGKKYRLISFDFPGHGESTFSDIPVEDYSLPGLVQILKKVISSLYAENAIFVGHGLGGHIILEALQELTWTRGVCIFGTPPLSTPTQLKSSYMPNKAFQLLFKGQLNKKDLADLSLAMAKQEFSDRVSGLLRKSDYRFRKYYGNWIKTGEFFNQKEFLRFQQIPIAIFQGEHDSLINFDFVSNLKIESLWGKKVRIIKDASHSPQMENPKEFISLLDKFLTTIV